ncbi:DUF6891 domain-containing protein [Streptomyces albipurpureus]|uniref:DUF6891 domain-containing protein n=1 Tax=Streptomyces albipurpureus TaxID=2897419 RepID=A0ABT0UUK8_9ACTN|nr:hypothetical protein [Streptomyces sp. CWNU-1]MCM2391058.1 hypothetical protein [Streptomyces sp. CWNU-1]
MLEIKVMTEDDEQHVRVTSSKLAELVRRTREGDGDRRSLLIQRIPDLPDVFIQVRRGPEAHFDVEYREGPRPMLQQEARFTDAESVARLLTGWAQGEDEWRAGGQWTPVDLGPEPGPVPELDDGVRQELERLVRQQLIAGYSTRSRLVERVRDHFRVTGDGLEAADGGEDGGESSRDGSGTSGADDPRGAGEVPDGEPAGSAGASDRREGGRRGSAVVVTTGQAESLVNRLWLERVAEQSEWEGETDPERLARAFAALDASGITARENFACCHSCGQAEIGGAGSPTARGFVYFHAQTAEQASERGLLLHYGGFDSSADTTRAIGREVVSALTEVGLATDWNDDPSKAIEVPLEWRRRLVG